MLNNEFPPLGGGTATVNLEFIKYLSQLPEFETHLITSSPGKTDTVEKPFENVTINRISVGTKCWHHAANLELIAYFYRSARLAFKLTGIHRYDCVFAWSTVPAGAVALLLYKLLGMPYLIRVMGPDIPGWEQRYKFIYPFVSPLIKLVWQNARMVITKSAGEAQSLSQSAPDISTVIIPNGVTPINKSESSRVLSHGPLKLICVGRLIKRKGQLDLIRAIKRLADNNISIHLTLVGDGDEKEAYCAETRKLGLNERVAFTGYVDLNSVQHYLQQSDVFVLPSYNESSSVATLEAMSAGLPLIVTALPGTELFAKQAVNGFTFSPGDVDTLCEYISLLAKDRELGLKMGQASRQMSLEWSWKKSFDEYLKVIQKICANGYKNSVKDNELFSKLNRT